MLVSHVLMTAENSTNTAKPSKPNLYRYTDVEQLSRYVTETGKILPRRVTHLTSAEQRHITRMIKRARNMLLMK